jgi:hypothetical protein
LSLIYVSCRADGCILIFVCEFVILHICLLLVLRKVIKKFLVSRGKFFQIYFLRGVNSSCFLFTVSSFVIGTPLTLSHVPNQPLCGDYVSHLAQGATIIVSLNIFPDLLVLSNKNQFKQYLLPLSKIDCFNSFITLRPAPRDLGKVKSNKYFLHDLSSSQGINYSPFAAAD